MTTSKLLASDYDKTFFYKTNPEALEVNLQAVEKWREKGNLFAISTGRDAASIGFERKVRDVDYDYLVSLNGSFIVDKDDNVLFKSALEHDLAKDIAAMLREQFDDELIVSNGFDGCNFTNRKKSQTDAVAREAFERNSKIYSKTIEESLEGEVLLLGCLSEDLEQAQKVRGEILDLYSDQVEVFINLNYINIVPKGISKASGIELIAKHAGVATDAVLAIGDDYNDIPMVESFVGYAVANAKPEVKAVANEVFESVAELIEKKM
ncbi:HAD-IIB family hydrolase [Vibrio hannami]|uniref:HAD-IIB family hydrolase n=1 Tax=Vibrio hannami TaxID=2717094 RepID=UPI0024107D26|nr:HAD-IIB family hydrolase [Vibrio hannami]MDG3085653.1 HAD-IIB family hydrolase [Vibrio hannami]